MKEHLTPTAMSNLLTMGICASADSRQAIPDKYIIPEASIRLLRAKLIFEEALETIQALGYDFGLDAGKITIYATGNTKVVFASHGHAPDLVGIIDGCCDTIYVATGTLCSVGAPDFIHLREVCAANARKFPDGVAKFNASGKYVKPDGWTGPDHQWIINAGYSPSLHDVSDDMIKSLRGK